VCLERHSALSQTDLDTWLRCPPPCDKHAVFAFAWMRSARACGAEPPAPAVQVNDVEMTNGVCHEAPPAAVGPRQMIDRTEYVRLLEQALHSLGFLAAAQALERESVRACALPRAPWPARPSSWPAHATSLSARHPRV
jgi:hypothetical protein